MNKVMQKVCIWSEVGRCWYHLLGCSISPASMHYVFLFRSLPPLRNIQTRKSATCYYHSVLNYICNPYYSVQHVIRARVAFCVIFTSLKIVYLILNLFYDSFPSFIYTFYIVQWMKKIITKSPCIFISKGAKVVKMSARSDWSVRIAGRWNWIRTWFLLNTSLGNHHCTYLHDRLKHSCILKMSFFPEIRFQEV
jgi:hypothetical protein